MKISLKIQDLQFSKPTKLIRDKSVLINIQMSFEQNFFQLILNQKSSQNSQQTI
jgi:hypothetical protein